jgi:hypothetical protein
MQTVSAPAAQATTTTISSSSNPSTAGRPVTFTAVVLPASRGGTPTGTVVFSVDGKTEAPVPLTAGSNGARATFSTAGLRAGSHTFTASYSGDATFAASAVRTALVQTVNPVISSVVPPTVLSLKRYGIHWQATVLVLTFSEPLDPASAKNPNNYSLVGPGGRPMVINSVVYDPVTNTVTLRPRDHLNEYHTFELTVFGSRAGGVCSARGVRLDGAGRGVAGSDYTASVTWRNIVWTPEEARRYLHLFTGKPAGPLG